MTLTIVDDAIEVEVRVVRTNRSAQTKFRSNSLGIDTHQTLESCPLE